MTRAQDILYFTYSDYYGTGKRPRKLSPFVWEALPNLKAEKEKKALTQQLYLTEVLSVYEENGEEEEKPPLKLSYITFSNLQMFDICPLHYKAKVIFNIPTPPAAVQSFEFLFIILCTDLQTNSKRRKPSLRKLLDLLAKEWISQGYDSKKYEEERFSQGKNLLDKFYKENCNPFIKPLRLEESFSFNLKNGVKVFGKIDRIDPKGKGIEIIDYKTGAENPKAKKAHELQLAMYALAATRIKDEVLNRDPKDITLTLYFLEGNTKKSMTFTKGDLDKLEDSLIEKLLRLNKVILNARKYFMQKLRI